MSRLALPLLLLASGLSSPFGDSRSAALGPPTASPVRAMAAGAPRAAQEDPLASLRGWNRGLRSGAPDLELRPSAESAVAALGLLWQASPDRRRELAAPLLDLAGLTLERADRGRCGPGELELAGRAGELLLERMDAELRGWLLHEVLTLERVHPPERRLAAVWLAGRMEDPRAQVALFASCRAADPLLRETALAALVGREDPAVHLFLIGLLADAEEGRCEARKGPIEQHFLALRPAPGTIVSNRVLAHLRERLKGTDWRAAARAISIARCLHDNVAFPPLIESLSIWLTREATDLPVKRVQGDLLGELERRSGRRLGLKPERWRALWKAVQAGELSLEGHVEGRPSFSQAGFFGLRPMTDRVTFVIDRSGSMDEAFGASTSAGARGRTRHAEAIAQLVGCLEELGPRTRFNVVLFSDAARTWRSQLQPATDLNLRAVALWARALQAGGGTHLRAGVEAALQLDRHGRLDLEALEADTIIVLCDGETAEGPGWVAPLLGRVQADARVVFHAVQVGGESDGTLQALCEGSGGDYVQVAP